MTNFNIKSKYKCFGALYAYTKKKSVLNRNLLLFKSRKAQNLKYLIVKSLSDYSLKQLKK